MRLRYLDTGRIVAMDASSLILLVLAAMAGFVVGGASVLGITRRSQSSTRARFEAKMLAEVEGLRKNHRQHSQRLVEAQETLEARLAESEQERAELQDRLQNMADELEQARVALTDMLHPRHAEPGERESARARPRERVLSGRP